MNNFTQIVIPADPPKAEGIQNIKDWIPHQVRNDDIKSVQKCYKQYTEFPFFKLHLLKQRGFQILNCGYASDFCSQYYKVINSR